MWGSRCVVEGALKSAGHAGCRPRLSLQMAYFDCHLEALQALPLRRGPAR